MSVEPLVKKIHNSFTCSPHTAACGHKQTDREWDTVICNPYYNGLCPTNGKGPGCTYVASSKELS